MEELVAFLAARSQTGEGLIELGFLAVAVIAVLYLCLSRPEGETYGGGIVFGDSDDGDDGGCGGDGGD